MICNSLLILLTLLQLSEFQLFQPRHQQLQQVLQFPTNELKQEDQPLILPHMKPLLLVRINHFTGLKHKIPAILTHLTSAVFLLSLLWLQVDLFQNSLEDYSYICQEQKTTITTHFQESETAQSAPPNTVTGSKSVLHIVAVLRKISCINQDQKYCVLLWVVTAPNYQILYVEQTGSCILFPPSPCHLGCPMVKFYCFLYEESLIICLADQGCHPFQSFYEKIIIYY